MLHFLYISAIRRAFCGPETHVDDWEQFFREKSVRRAKRERLRRLIPMIIWSAVVGAAAAGLIAAVSGMPVVSLPFGRG